MSAELVMVALIYGALAGLAFRALADRAALGRAMKRVVAHVMEFRLFMDEPGLVFRAQRGALRANGEALRAVALPCLVAGLPLILGWGFLEGRYGHGPLRAGEAAAMTARVDLCPVIKGLAVETPGVRVVRTGEVVWRVRARWDFAGPLPAGFDLAWPRSGAWVVWFGVFSLLGSGVGGAWRASLGR